MKFNNSVRYERDVMRKLEKYVIANMEIKWELRVDAESYCT